MIMRASGRGRQVMKVISSSLLVPRGKTKHTNVDKHHVE
jgi:hypothetical protein